MKCLKCGSPVMGHRCISCGFSAQDSVFPSVTAPEAKGLWDSLTLESKLVQLEESIAAEKRLEEKIRPVENDLKRLNALPAEELMKNEAQLMQEKAEQQVIYDSLLSIRDTINKAIESLRETIAVEIVAWLDWYDPELRDIVSMQRAAETERAEISGEYAAGMDNLTRDLGVTQPEADADQTPDSTKKHRFFNFFRS